MELRQLQYAVQIAADRNFSRAAEKLHIAQPSLSQQLSKLEKEINLLLFQRNTNSVEVTHAGTVFVEKASFILDQVAQLKKEMEDLLQMRSGRLVIGSLPITGSQILPMVLPEFRKKHPGIEVVLVEETTLNLENLTSSGQTDLSLLTLPLVDESLEYEPLIEEELCLAVPPTHPLAHEKREIAIAELRDEPFIMLKKGQGFRQIAIEMCRNAGFEPTVVFESSNIETVQALVGAGMGIAFIPSMIARSVVSSYMPTLLNLIGRPKRTLVIARRKGRYLSKAAEAFIDTAREVVK
ncbi:LysR family transcriptional regulator [Gorillibacterium massiliense]|uniref:LysR family transcriptional regulator n=1 Tax=Gorillibacterium massiliense TaxID=1280390 RepID=UPI0004AF2FAE|nr:LysR family transcriptional regulator [Gorillibacterium massiliense]